MSDATAPADVKLCLMEAVNKLGPEELAELLSREANTTNLFRTIQPDFEYAARRLSEIAPEKAAELWLKRKGAFLGGEALLAPWAKQHPEDFVSWSLGLPADAQKAAAGGLGELARENPSLFASLAPRLEHSPGGVAGARLPASLQINLLLAGPLRQQDVGERARPRAPGGHRRQAAVHGAARRAVGGAVHGGEVGGQGHGLSIHHQQRAQAVRCDSHGAAGVVGLRPLLRAVRLERLCSSRGAEQERSSWRVETAGRAAAHYRPPDARHPACMHGSRSCSSIAVLSP